MNNLIQYPLPDWLSIAFLIAIPIPFIIIGLFVRKETLDTPYNKAFLKLILFFVLYLSYITFASFNGFFNQVSFPPKVVLLCTLPFALILFLIFGNSKTYKFILEKVRLENLVSLHIFRLIGVFFILLALFDSLPKTFAFIAGTGDILSAIGSIFVFKAIKDNKPYAKTLCKFWNIFGTLDILFTIIAANVLTKLSINTGSMGVDTLGLFPYCIIPAFAPPMILFLHWSIYKKMNFSERN